MIDNTERRYILDIAEELKSAVGGDKGGRVGRRERKVIALAKKLEEAVK